MKEKTESTFAKLHRLTVEHSDIVGEGGSKRKLILTECVLSISQASTHVDMITTVQLGTSNMMRTYMQLVNLPKTSGMLSSSIR